MSRPWLPLYVADYLRDTRRLTPAEHGAYLLLIMEYWTAGGLPGDDRQMCRITGMTGREWQHAKPTISTFFTPDWRHKRIDAELAKAAEISSKRSANALQMHSKRSANAHANAEQEHTHARAGLLQPQSQEESKDAASAAPSSKYFFESGVIRLTKKNFDEWVEAFPNLSLRAELLSLSEWAGSQPKWFFAVSSALAKRNRDIGIKLKAVPNGRPLTPDGQRWPDGIV